MTLDGDQRRTFQEKSILWQWCFLFQIKLTHSLSIKEYWEQTSMIWWWVTAEASLPRRESGTLSRILQRASCLTPPTLRPTLRFSLRLLRIRKLLSEISQGESSMSSSLWWGKYFIHGSIRNMLWKSFLFAKFLSIYCLSIAVKPENCCLPLSRKIFYPFFRNFYEQLLAMLPGFIKMFEFIKSNLHVKLHLIKILWEICDWRQETHNFCMLLFFRESSWKFK